MSPRVSVLLPVRDAERTLGECLESLFAQSLADFEIIAVDDGSRDDSARLLARAAARPEVRILAGGRGLPAALNAALRAARAPLVARMDADDRAHPERLERQVRRMQAAPGIHVLGCRVRLLADPPHRGGGMRRYVAWQNRLLDDAAIRRDLLVESPLVHPSVVMRREAVVALGGYTEEPVPEDYDLWLRGARAGWRFAKCPEVLLEWRDGPDRLTRRDPRYGRDRFDALKLRALESGPLPAGRGVVVWGAGPIGKGWARRLAARGHRVLAFVEVAPRRLGQRIAGAPVVSVEGAAGFAGALHLAAVGQPGARERIRRAAARLGLRDGPDLVAVA